MKKFIIEVSIDDGSILDLKTAQLVKAYSLPCTFYIVVDNVGKEGYLSWEQIKELDKQGFTIGSHTMSHPSDLKLLYNEQLHYEIQNSKDMIETVLGHTISKFCYPRGRADQRIKDFVAQAGYIEARGTGIPGIIKRNDPFYLPGTIHIFDRKEYMGKSIVDFAKETIDRAKEEGGYINCWGHSNELERYHLFGVLEEVLEYATK